MLQTGLMLGLVCFGCHQMSLFLSINRLLDYAITSGETSNAFLLGAFIAKAHVKASEEMLGDGRKSQDIKRISEKLDIILSRSNDLIDPQVVNRTNLLRSLDGDVRLKVQDLNYSLADWRYLEFGVPSRYESDKCMLPLLDGCKQPPSCTPTFTHTFSTGYSLVHRALFLSLLNLMGCEDGASSKLEIMENIRSICSQVLAENEQIVRLGFPLNLQDLFIEQVGVCGINLYKEFLSDKKLDLILRNSKLFNSRNGQKKRISKSSWDNHLSGVGLAALSAFLTRNSLISSEDLALYM